MVRRPQQLCRKEGSTSERILVYRSKAVPCAMRPPSSFRRLPEKKTVRARARRKGHLRGCCLCSLSAIPADMIPCVFPVHGRYLDASVSAEGFASLAPLPVAEEGGDSALQPCLWRAMLTRDSTCDNPSLTRKAGPGKALRQSGRTVSFPDVKEMGLDIRRFVAVGSLAIKV